jgi:hypothetical protein
MLTSEYMVQILSKGSLIKIEEFMSNNGTLKLIEFMRLLRELLPFKKDEDENS